MSQFKCAENEEHVKQVNITDKDAFAVFDFLEHFDVPCSFTRETLLEACAKCETSADRHNLVHELLDDVVTAKKNGNEVVNDPLFIAVMEALVEAQDKCRNGEDHETRE